MSRDSAVGIVDSKGVGVRILIGVHPTSYQMGTRALSMVEREAHHSHPTCAEVKNTWINKSTFTYIFMAQSSFC
jgi:hypothetical protein